MSLLSLVRNRFALVFFYQLSTRGLSDARILKLPKRILRGTVLYGSVMQIACPFPGVSHSSGLVPEPFSRIAKWAAEYDGFGLGNAVEVGPLVVGSRFCKPQPRAGCQRCYMAGSGQRVFQPASDGFQAFRQAGKMRVRELNRPSGQARS